MSGLTKANALPATPIVLAMGTLDSPVVYDDIANLGDFDGPSSSSTINDVSHHGDLTRRIVTTLINFGEVSCPLWFIPASGQEPSHTDPTNGVFPVFTRQDLRAYALFYRDDAGTALFFNAYISKFSQKSPVDGVLVADCTIAIDGPLYYGTEAGGPNSAVFPIPEA